MPALLILALISWLFGSGKKRVSTEAPLFTAFEVHPGKPWGALLASVALHSVALTLLYVASDILSFTDDSLQVSMRPLVIKLPDHLYWAPSTGNSPPTSAHAAGPSHLSVRRSALRRFLHGPDAQSASKHGLQSPPEPSPVVAVDTPKPLQSEPRKFQLPDLPVRKTAAQTLLQPELPPNILPQAEKQLPQILFWAADPRIKPPAPDLPVQPGNLKPPAETPKLDSPPRLTMPNRETLVADLSMAAALAASNPQLPQPAATSLPIQVSEHKLNQEVTQNSSIDPFTGQPVHVLAVSPDPAPLVDAFRSLLIPAGNQMARPPGTPLDLGFGALTGSGSAGPFAQGGGRDQEFENAPVGGPGTLSGASASLSEGPAELLHSLPGDGRIFGLVVPPGVNGKPLRVLHSSNGVFDVVVVQSSSSVGFQEAAQALSGRPIYTVYLEVGAPKEWVLQYCLPNNKGPIQTGNIIQLGSPAPVSAPYPMVTVRPPEGWRYGNEYLLVHGYLDTAGRFRDLRILPAHQARPSYSEALLQYLTHWEFRPAAQDGQPVMVEVILAVPPDQLT
ncbi:MAG: hypothetical protein DMG57_13780 [Acidobacteria bacterium]|nr:MAG: hypothetical protein DMG57_13780 [Acidobacteriota bacterium]